MCDLPPVPVPFASKSEPENKRVLVDHLARHGMNVIMDEWDVVPGASQFGCGDLIFQFPCGTHVVVEIKWINLNRTGRTTRVKRTKHRKKVVEQARAYASQWRREHPATRVVAATFTNETGVVFLDACPGPTPRPSPRVTFFSRVLKWFTASRRSQP